MRKLPMADSYKLTIFNMVRAFYATGGGEEGEDPIEIEFPQTDNNAGYETYKDWLALGNQPEPALTAEELEDKAKADEIAELKSDLRNTDHWLFRMILEVWEVGVAKGLWTNADITDSVLKGKVTTWKTKLDRLKELGE